MDKTLGALHKWLKANGPVEIPVTIEEEAHSWGLLSLIPIGAVGASIATQIAGYHYISDWYQYQFLGASTALTLMASCVGGACGLYSGYWLYTMFPGRFVRKVQRAMNPLRLFAEDGKVKTNFFGHKQIETVKDLVDINGFDIDLLLKQIDAVESQKVLEARRAEVAAQKLEERLFEVSEAILAKVGEA